MQYVGIISFFIVEDMMSRCHLGSFLSKQMVSQVKKKHSYIAQGEL